jgi:hypothetical protein
MVVRKGNELKLVFPQMNGAPERYASLDFDCFYLQPMDGPDRIRNTEAAGALLFGASAVAAEPADAQVNWEFLSAPADGA